MSKLAQRLLVFLLGVPAVAALVLLLPHRGHLALGLAVVFFSAVGAAEFSAMLGRRGLGVPKLEAALLGALLPAAALISRALGLCSPAALAPAFLAAGAAWLLLSRLFRMGAELDGFAGGVAGGLSAMLYPGAFMMWIVAMARWDGAGAAIIAFLAMVFGGDSLAWAAGMLFGKGNRGIVPASPNKSAAGFAGGVLGPMIVGAGAALLFPEIFAPSRGGALGLPAFAGALAGLIVGCAAILGDLAESALKRSAGVKDSGSFIIGRGGVLDSVDSVAMAAPAFYACFALLFLP